MGNCVGKDGGEETKKRLRWAVGSHEPGLLGGSSHGSTAPADRCWEVLGLLPQGTRKFAVCGQPCDTAQKGFTDKAASVHTVGPDKGDIQRVGWACKKGLKPDSPNQDDFCIYGVDRAGLFGVFDGHGPWGHDVSSFVQEALPRALLQHPSFSDRPEEALAGAFEGTHRRCVELQAVGQLDCSLSGTTATVALHRDGTLHMAHVGDSRAVVGRLRDGKLVFEDLTVDHKPTCEEERRRIEASGGEVRRLDDDVPHRVFLRGKMYPGLAMTRAIGDTIGIAAGLTSTPTVRTFQVLDDWHFLLLCSDGVWEFMSSQQAVDIAQGCAKSGVVDAQKAADQVAAAAWERWIEEEANVVDDITVICAVFERGL